MRGWRWLTVLIVLPAFVGITAAVKAEKPLMWEIKTKTTVSVYAHEDDLVGYPKLFLSKGCRLTVMAFKHEGDDLMVLEGKMVRVIAMDRRTWIHFALAGIFTGEGWMYLPQVEQQIILTPEKETVPEDTMIQVSYEGGTK